MERTSNSRGNCRTPENKIFAKVGEHEFSCRPVVVDRILRQRGTSAMRFGLSETVTNTIVPMAIDNHGQRAFPIAGNGLTVVDLVQSFLTITSFSVLVTLANLRSLRTL